MAALMVRPVGRDAWGRSSGIAGAPEAAEDLAADGVVPVAKRVANRPGPRGPRAAAEDLVLGAEEDLGILRVRETLEAGPRPEITGRPLPHVADHAVAADRRDAGRVAPNRRGAEGELVDI